MSGTMAEAGIHNLVFSISYAPSPVLQADGWPDSMGIGHHAGISQPWPEQQKGSASGEGPVLPLTSCGVKDPREQADWGNPCSPHVPKPPQ